MFEIYQLKGTDRRIALETSTRVAYEIIKLTDVLTEEEDKPAESVRLKIKAIKDSRRTMAPTPSKTFELKTKRPYTRRKPKDDGMKLPPAESYGKKTGFGSQINRDVEKTSSGSEFKCDNGCPDFFSVLDEGDARCPQCDSVGVIIN